MPRKSVHIDRTLAARLDLDQDALATYLATLNISTTAGTGAAATASPANAVELTSSTTSCASTPLLPPSEDAAKGSGGAGLTPRAITPASTPARATTTSSTTTSTSSHANGVLLTPSGSTLTSSNASTAESDDETASSTPTITNTRDGTASISGASSAPSNQDILDFFNAHYGRDGERLVAWQELCRHLNVSPVPGSIKKCKKALRQIHINIHDFVRSHYGSEAVPRFANLAALRTDIRSSRGRRFPREAAKANPILTWMLVNVYFN